MDVKSVCVKFIEGDSLLVILRGTKFFQIYMYTYFGMLVNTNHFRNSDGMIHSPVVNDSKLQLFLLGIKLVSSISKTNTRLELQHTISIFKTDTMAIKWLNVTDGNSCLDIYHKHLNRMKMHAKYTFLLQLLIQCKYYPYDRPSCLCKKCHPDMCFYMSLFIT